MKLFRIGYFTALAGFLFAARLTGRREFFLLFFMLLFVALYALTLNVWTALSFSYVQELTAGSSIKGASTRLRLAIYNDKPFPFTLMQIAVETATPTQPVKLQFNLSPKSRICFDLPIHGVYRGLFSVGMTVVDISDVFGLFRLRYDMRRLPYYRQRTLKIYPRLLALSFLPAPSKDSKRTGSSGGRLADSGETYADLRAYRAGDPWKRIHWKASARKGDLLVKSYDLPLETAALVAVDTSAVFQGEDALRYADLACECAAAIVHRGLRAGHLVSVTDAASSPQRSSDTSPKRFAELYEWLTLLPFGVPCEGFAQSIRKSVRNNPGLRAVYALTASADQPLRVVLCELARMGCAVTCLLLVPPAEKAAANSVCIPGVTLRVLAFGEDLATATEAPL